MKKVLEELIPRNPGSFAVWLTNSALTEEEFKRLEPDMKRNPDNSIPVTFALGGVKLSWSQVVKNMYEKVYKSVTAESQMILDKKYRELLADISSVHDRILHHGEIFSALESDIRPSAVWNTEYEEVDCEYDADGNFISCKRKHWYVCSKCGRKELVAEPYCHCGAKMLNSEEEKKKI